MLKTPSYFDVNAMLGMKTICQTQHAPCALQVSFKPSRPATQPFKLANYARLGKFRVLQGLQIVHDAWQTSGHAQILHSTTSVQTSILLLNVVAKFSVGTVQMELPELMEERARAV